MTIQGSSDHIFELFLKKAKSIIGIDTNPLTERLYYLKLAVFAVLITPEEFLKFFRWHDYPKFGESNYKNALDKDIFEEISKYLLGDSRLFWEDLFKSYEPSAIRKNLFNAVDETNNQALYQALSYLSKENYEYIRKNRDRINFHFMNADIRNLDDELLEKQDFIILTNLIIYAHSMYPDKPLQGFKQLIEHLSSKLNKNGQIMAGYLYDIENEVDFRGVYKQRLRDAVFNDPEYTYYYVRRMHDLECDEESQNHDACLIYTKR